MEYIKSNTALILALIIGLALVPITAVGERTTKFHSTRAITTLKPAVCEISVSNVIDWDGSPARSVGGEIASHDDPITVPVLVRGWMIGVVGDRSTNGGQLAAWRTNVAGMPEDLVLALQGSQLAADESGQSPITHITLPVPIRVDFPAGEKIRYTIPCEFAGQIWGYMFWEEAE